jgi:hypothetical protein
VTRRGAPVPRRVARRSRALADPRSQGARRQGHGWHVGRRASKFVSIPHSDRIP